MRMRFLSLCLFAVLAFTFDFVPAQARAANGTCDCYCTGQTGAVDQNAKLTSTACQTRCEDQGSKIAAFACTANQYPARLPSCFTKDHCDDQKGVWDTKFQPQECSSGMHYCYPDPANQMKTDLQVQIGGLAATGDIGEYVKAAYDWMIGTATLLAIIWIMVGGLQWAFSAVSAEQVGKAKKRMMSGVAGLVLLLSSYLILYTVNPRLLSLEVPDFPLIRTVNVTGEASCEQLKSDGYELDYEGVEECGTTAKVERDPDGKEMADGSVCNFSFCPGGGGDTQCIPGDTPTCMKCEQLTPNNGVVLPTQAICSSFNSLSSYTPTTEEKSFSYTPNAGLNAGRQRQWTEMVTKTLSYCFFSRDDDVGGEVSGSPACARVSLDCGGVTSCRSYDDIPVFYGSTYTSLDNVDIGRNSGLPGTDAGLLGTLYGSAGDITLGSFCGHGQFDDICRWNRTNQEEACGIDQTSLVPIANAISQAVAPATYDCQSK